MDENDAVQPGIIALPTDHPREFFILGADADLDAFGDPVATAPPHLARHATTLRSVVEGAQTYGELSGRLVLVDSKTATAMRAGRMLRDEGGQMIAVVRRADGKFESLARLRSVGSAAASVSALSNALSAMALQAQLDRIERRLSEISNGVNHIAQEQMLQWHAQTHGAQDIILEVYRTANRAGALTAANWSQITSIGQVVRAQIRGDRQRLEQTVRELERAVKERDLKSRESEVTAQVTKVLAAYTALSRSTRAWVQYSSLRLWHLTVADDPTLDSYRDELLSFVAESEGTIGPLGERARAAIDAVLDSRWFRRARRPFVAKRLPRRQEAAYAELARADWSPLEIQPPGQDVVRWQPS